MLHHLGGTREPIILGALALLGACFHYLLDVLITECPIQSYGLSNNLRPIAGQGDKQSINSITSNSYRSAKHQHAAVRILQAICGLSLAKVIMGSYWFAQKAQGVFATGNICLLFRVLCSCPRQSWAGIAPMKLLGLIVWTLGNLAMAASLCAITGAFGNILGLLGQLHNPDSDILCDAALD